MFSTEELHRPWETLLELIEQGDAKKAQLFLDTLPGSEVGRAVSRLSDDERTRLMGLLAPEHAAEVVENLPDSQAAELMANLEPSQSAAIIEQLWSDDQADILSDLAPDDAEAILSEMSPQGAREARILSSYPKDVAGGLMTTEHLVFSQDFTVAQVLSSLRDNAEKYRDYQVQYAYVTHRGELSGVLRLRDLVFAPADQRIREILIGSPISVLASASLEHLQNIFEEHSFFGVPVVDEERHVLGVVTRGAVEAARADRSDSDYLKSLGIVGGEETRTMPLLLRSRRRLSWLTINVGLNLLAAGVIAFYQETLAAVIALAMFLPIVSDMSGCSGNQAVAVSMRELSLGLIKPQEVLRVLLKEVSLGAITGVVLGVLIATAAWLWDGNPYLGLVIGTAMALNTVIAVSLGGTLPLIMRRMSLDPALASGPILTTVTDMCGFFLVLSLASSALPLLT